MRAAVIELELGTPMVVIRLSLYAIITKYTIQFNFILLFM